MNKTQYIVLGLIVAVLIAAVVVVMFIFGGLGAPAAAPADTTSQNGLPDSRPAINPDTGTSLRKDILKDPQTKEDSNNKGHYFVGNYINPAVNTSPTVPYVIEYIAATDYFNIALMQEPLGSARMQAEQYLMQHLGITQTEMCHLKYMVTTPAWVSTAYANTSLGFSFCPGATKLP
ncbi:MAG: hypothetical protein V4474_00815 [Patescibacteria group bacterium]